MGFKLWISLSFLHHGQIISQGSQAGLELLVVQLTRLVFVEMPAIENDARRFFHDVTMM